jgi:nuclease HARBI1
MAILLSRLSMPSRVVDLEQRFCRAKGAINEISYETLECFIKWASPLVLEFQGNYLRSRAQQYARKLAAKSRNATQLCLEFIDGTLIEIARLPDLMQRATYSGHKKRPGLKWQVVTTPDGMLFHVFGPFEGRDMQVYAESGLDDVLGDSLLIGGIQYHLYGDSGYALRPYLMTPFEGAALTTDEALFNKRMSKVRVSVEWAFKDIKKYFSKTLFPGRWYFQELLRVHGTWQVACFGISGVVWKDRQPPCFLIALHPS